MIEVIETEPKRLDMGCWLLPAYGYGYEDAPPCGTIGCIAGWAVAIHGARATDQVAPGTNIPVRTDMDYMFGVAGKAWELLGGSLRDDVDPDALFYPALWPGWYKFWLRTSTSKNSQSRTTVKRIRHYVRTGK